MLNRPQIVLFRSAAAWTGIGLVGGLAYREATRAAEYPGFTQLAVVHTHALVLGSLTFLLVLVFERLYLLSADRRLQWFVWLWNVGLVLTVGGMAVKGSLQVAGSATADSPALAGFSGTGHIVLTVAFVVLFLVLGARIRDTTPASIAVGVDQP